METYIGNLQIFATDNQIKIYAFNLSAQVTFFLGLETSAVCTQKL